MVTGINEFGMSSRSTVHWLLAALFSLSGCADSSDTTAAQTGMTSICEITRHPDAFDGRGVTVRGFVDTDYFEFFGLLDRSCPNTVIEWGGDGSHSSSLQRLITRVYSLRGDSSRRVEVTLTGVFEWHRGSVPTWVIEPTAAINPRVVRTTSGDQR